MQICVRSGSLCLRGQNGEEQVKMQQLFPNWCGFNLNSVAFYYFCSRWTVVLIFSRNPQKILLNQFHAQFLRWVPSVLIGPRHEVCAFDLPLHVHTYMCAHICNVQTNTKPVYTCAYSKNVRWLAPFGNMEYLICPFQFHPHARARPPINVVAICCTMHILPPDWPPGLSIALWFAHMCICSTRSRLEHWSGLLKYYNQSCKPWNNYWFEFNR